MVEAAVHTNRHEQALAHVEAMRAADMGALSYRYALMLATAEAMVAPEGPAMSLFDSALATPDAHRWPFDLGRVHLAYGERLRRARQYTQARAQLTSALEIFQLLAAAPWVSRVMSQLQAISGVREPAGAPVTRLTSRELEVATLAASGLTNGQIAARLGTSPRTVGTHLSHVFDKLVVSSRAGLPDALAGRGDHWT